MCCSAPTFLEFYKKVLVSLGRSVNGSAVNDVPLMVNAVNDVPSILSVKGNPGCNTVTT